MRYLFIFLCLLLLGCGKTTEDQFILSEDVIYEAQEVEETNYTDQMIKDKNSFQTSKELYDMESYLSDLKRLDQYAKEFQIDNLTEWNYLRSGKYHDEYWIQLMGEENMGFYEYVNNKEPNLLREETYVSIENSPYIIKTAHLAGTVCSIKSGIGSLGGWKGDLAELARELESYKNEGMTFDYYHKAYQSFLKEDGSCSRYDIDTDIIATNISAICGSEDKISESMEEYFLNIPCNQYSLFLQNEFSLEQVDRNKVRSAIARSFRNDIYVKYLLRSFEIDNEYAMSEICYAFADYLYDMAKDDLGNTKSEDSKHKQKIQSEDLEAKIEKTVEIGKWYWDNGGKEKFTKYMEKLNKEMQNKPSFFQL